MKTLVSWTGLILIGFGIWVSFIVLWIYLTQKPPYSVPFGDITVIVYVGLIIFIFVGLRMIKVDERTIYSKLDINLRHKKCEARSMEVRLSRGELLSPCILRI